MKTIKYIGCIIFTVFLFSSCEDYLDKKADNAAYLTEDDVWSDREKIESMAHRLYDCTEWFFETRFNYGTRQESETGKNYSDICVASGEFICTRNIASISQVAYGDWFSSVNNNSFGNPDFYYSWEDSWEAIYVANQILDRIDDVTDDVMNEYDRLQIKGEAYLFRGWAYHEISKRWGAMPYFRTKLSPTMDYNLERPSLSQQIEDIVTDLDSAVMFLQEVSFLDDPINMGRCGKAAALAVKSRALTTAASPNFQDDHGSDPEMWERAAEAAWEVIELSRTEDKIGLYEGEYNNIFNTEKGTIEGLWPRYHAPIDPLRFNLSYLWSHIGGYHGYSPTQEIIDKFETADGWPVHDSRYDGLSGYDEQNPYVNRDPRFYKDILYHGSLWSLDAENQSIDMRTAPEIGKDRTSPDGNDFGNSKTGYLCRKIIPDKFNRNNYDVKKYINSPYIRMAEMYLNYAEAVNEAYKDPNAHSPSADISAVEALNAIRTRVGQADVRSEFTSDWELFKERVRNEFYVELCFEYYIWHARIRWRTAHLFDGYNFHGVKIIEDASQPTGLRYERFPINIERHFEEKHYRYPLRQSDLQLNDKLEQNPGW